MKKTNVALLRNVRLAKVLPLFFAFFVVSAVQLNAQSFLPLDEALAAVQVEIEEYKDDMSQQAGVTAITLSSSEMQEAFNARYYTAFKDFAKQRESLEAGLADLDNLFDPQNPKPDQREMIQSARDSLIEIISE